MCAQGTGEPCCNGSCDYDSVSFLFLCSALSSLMHALRLQCEAPIVLTHYLVPSLQDVSMCLLVALNSTICALVTAAAGTSLWSGKVALQDAGCRCPMQG